MSDSILKELIKDSILKNRENYEVAVEIFNVFPSIKTFMIQDIFTSIEPKIIEALGDEVSVSVSPDYANNQFIQINFANHSQFQIEFCNYFSYPKIVIRGLKSEDLPPVLSDWIKKGLQLELQIPNYKFNEYRDLNGLYTIFHEESVRIRWIEEFVTTLLNRIREPAKFLAETDNCEKI